MRPQSLKSMINDQWTSSKRNINESMINDNNLRELHATRIAKALVEKFDAPNSYKFFLKCGYRMSENDIWTTYELAHKDHITSPIRYFVASCAKRPEMAN